MQAARAAGNPRVLTTHQPAARSAANVRSLPTAREASPARHKLMRRLPCPRRAISRAACHHFEIARRTSNAQRTPGQRSHERHDDLQRTTAREISQRASSGSRLTATHSK